MNSLLRQPILSRVCHHIYKGQIFEKPFLITFSARNYFRKLKTINENNDRRIPVDVDTSIEYMKSEEFKKSYRNRLIWELFRRNFKGQFSPAVPRLFCITEGWINTNNPCVICRDRYLVLDYKNVELLKHFINPHSGYVYPNTVLCLCREQFEKLCSAVTQAKNYGLIDFDVPDRRYSFQDHYGHDHKCNH